MPRKRAAHPATEISDETARTLFLVYGLDAVEMAELRCRELEAAGDKGGLANWKQVLEHVRTLAAGNPGEQETSH
jgi:hypothetical protein